MILEVADIRITPGQQAAFEQALAQGIEVAIGKAQGFAGYKLNRGVEQPERYLLMIYWQTLEDHTVGFRQGPLFAQWRALVGPYFAGPPTVEHFELAHMSS